MEKNSKLEQLMHKIILVSIKTKDNHGTLVSSKEFYGSIINVSTTLGIDIMTDKGEIHTIPPRLDNIHVAQKGTYYLKSNNEKVVNPDYVSKWILRVNDGDNNEGC